MRETMGEIIKRLRKERGLTQEELAQKTGVTFQAVSKWENDLGMPDISQVVPLASIFDVSTDVLFGLNGINNAEEVNKLILSAHSLIDSPATKKGLHSCYDALRKGLEKYPNNTGLLLQRLETGISLAYPENECYDEENGELIYKNCIKEADIVIKQSKNVTDILRVHMIMVLLHAAYGNTESAKAHAEHFPWRADMTAHKMRAYIAHFGKDYQAEGRHWQTDFLYHFEAMLDDAVRVGRCYSLLGNYNDAEYSLKQALSLTELVCGEEESDLYFHVREYGDIYCLLAEIYMETDRAMEALKMLEKTVDCDLMEYKKRGADKKINSPLLRDADYDFRAAPSGIMEKLRLKLKSPAFSKLEKEEAFVRLSAKVNGIR